MKPAVVHQRQRAKVDGECIQKNKGGTSDEIVKKSVALFLAVVMAVAVLVVPASAASSEWVGRFKKFAVTKISSYQAKYACAVQSILLGYDTYTLSCISDHGGVDGNFGTNTMNAVRHFQEKESLSVDGSVGPATWGKMATIMKTYVSTAGETVFSIEFTYNGNKTGVYRDAITAKYYGGAYDFYYHQENDNSLGDKFASVY